MYKTVSKKSGEAIQKAIEELSEAGGGVVHLSPGLYQIRSAIKLRSNIILKGEGRTTVLRRSPFFRTRLLSDGRRGERTVRVKNPERFEAGMEIIFRDRRYANYHSYNKPWAIIKEINGNRFLLDRALPHSFSVKRGATVMNGFPIIYGRNLEGAAVENLVLDGKRPPGKATEAAGECEGVQLTRCKDCKVLDCVAYACGGFGISCSGGENITFLNCDSYRNAWPGYHVGSGGKGGASHCTVQNCRAHHNDFAGIYICWNVTESIFSGNYLTYNKGDGLLIGPFDNGNLITNNIISHNGGCGIIVCRRAFPNRLNSFTDNLIFNNGRPGQTPAIKIENPRKGVYEQLFFTGNMIVETRAVKKAKASAIYLAEQTDYIGISNNFIQGKWKSIIENRSTGRHNCIQM